MPYVTGEVSGPPHKAFYWKADHIHAMRKGDWKFLLSTRDNWAELYHISEDKYETYDLSKEKPEVLIQLQEDYDAWMKQQAPPLWPRIMDHIFIIDGKTYKFPA